MSNTPERAALEALKAILRDPHGCRFCDSGKLRDATKRHDASCGYPMADAVISAEREWLMRQVRAEDAAGGTVSVGGALLAVSSGGAGEAQPVEAPRCPFCRQLGRPTGRVSWKCEPCQAFWGGPGYEPSPEPRAEPTGDPAKDAYIQNLRTTTAALVARNTGIDGREPRAEPPVGEVEALARETMERLFDKAKLAYYTFDGEPDHTLAVSIIAAALRRRVSASPASTGSAEVYPNSDRGLLAMTERFEYMNDAARLGTLRGIQTAAFRAGRADALLASTASAQQRPTREAVEALRKLGPPQGSGLGRLAASSVYNDALSDVLALYDAPAQDHAPKAICGLVGRNGTTCGMPPFHEGDHQTIDAPAQDAQTGKP
jgi:hypothetical protein